MSAAGSTGSPGRHFSELGLLSRALYLSRAPSDVSMTSTSVKMVITFREGEKRVFQLLGITPAFT